MNSLRPSVVKQVASIFFVPFRTAHPYAAVQRKHPRKNWAYPRKNWKRPRK